MKTIVIDFETYYSSKNKYSLRNLSIVEYVNHPEFYIQGCAVKIDAGETKWLSSKEVVPFFETIDWSTARVVAHNIKFDGFILKRLGYTPAQYVDTKAMAKAVLGNQLPSASLRDVAEYFGLPAKGQLNTNNKKELTAREEQELAEYCIRDVDLCHDIFHELMKHIPGSQWEIIDWTIRAFLEPNLCIDGKRCEELYDKLIHNKHVLTSKAGISKKVLASNQQFAKLLQDEGFSIPLKKNPKGESIPALSIQDKEFLEMKEQGGRLGELCEARIAVKQTLEETRAKKMADVAKVSRYCFDVIFSGAQQTHRFSGGNGCAGNPQNFRRGSELRGALGVEDGQSLVVADFANIELRVLAFLSQDPQLMFAIHEQKDVYCEFATRIYGRTITKKDKKERMLGKAAVLGLGYGMGHKKFANTVYSQTGETLDPDFAKQVVNLYRNTYTGVPMFWRTCDSVLDKIHDGYVGSFPHVPFLGLEKNSVVLPSGLKIKYPDLRFQWKQMFRKWRKEWAYDRYKSQRGSIDETKIYGGMMTENLCQGLAGEICKEAISRLIQYGYPPSGQVHDELLVVCDEEEVEKVKYLVTAAMTSPMSWWPELPLKVEIEAGKNWLEAK